MVEQSYKEEANPLRYHGDYHSGKELCEMALNSLKRHEVVISRLVGQDKNLSGAKEVKKATLVWRLFILVLLGACGLYICLAGVDRGFVSPKQSFEPLQQANSELCSRPSKSSSDILEHFPTPETYDRGHCACTPVHYFVLLSMQRSGSGWFETLLNDHPNISSHGEIFSVKERKENFTTIRQTLDTVYSLDWTSSAAKNHCTAAVGHKWMLNQGVMEYHREIAKYYEERGVSVVLLVRRNLLKRLISILANAYDKRVKPLNGTHKSHVHSSEEAKVLAEYKPTINMKYLPGNLQRVSEITADAVHFFNSTRLTVVYYEDLIQDPKSILEIQEFLGVPPRDLSSRQVKIHTKPLREQIENWEEVVTKLKGTEYESFLGDDDNS